MPDGVVRWFDAAHGDAEVVRGGRAYRVPAWNIEPSARHAGARVHFDVRRDGGAEEAIDVRLRLSARSSRHHHRFGTLQGARRFDTKGSSPGAGAHPELHLAGAHPMLVARSWATDVARGDVTDALALYAPDAVVHADGRAFEGRAALSAWLEASPAFGCACHARAVGSEDGVLVTWEPEAPGEPSFHVRSRMAHGVIAEQWELATAAADQAGEAGQAGEGGEPAPPVSMYTRGEVDEPAKAQARAAVSRAVATLEEPVLFARVKLVVEPDPARPRPARAEAMLDVNGDPLRAHAAGSTMAEAVDALEHRVRDQLEHRARRRDDLHHSEGVARPGEWRHADLPQARPPYFDRPAEERQLVRHKTFAIGELTPDEAIFDMEALDYDFYLFVDLASGVDSIVEPATGGSYLMTRVRPADAELGPTAQPVEVSGTEVPALDLDEAIERLAASGERHLFFADAASGRGTVLYVRYDGHYGLITPE